MRIETFHNAIEDFKLPCPYQKCLKTINRMIVRELGPWIRIFRMLRKTSCMSPFRRQEYYLVKGQNKSFTHKKKISSVDFMHYQLKGFFKRKPTVFRLKKIFENDHILCGWVLKVCFLWRSFSACSLLHTAQWKHRLWLAAKQIKDFLAIYYNRFILL